MYLFLVITCFMFSLFLYYLSYFSSFRLHWYPMRDRYRRVRAEAVHERWYLQRSHKRLQVHLRRGLHRHPLPDQHRRLYLVAVQERRHLPGWYREVHVRVSGRLHRRLLRDQHQRLRLESVSQRYLHRRREQLHLQLLPRLHRQAVPDADR